MVTANDVAAYILTKTGTITSMKMQKLVYYSQAWSLVWDEEQLFSERIEAWANGPVIPALYELHQGIFSISSWTYGDADKLQGDSEETVDAVIAHYGRLSAQKLSDLTHKEHPWRDARAGLPESERGDREISLASMHEYYSGLFETDE